METKTIRFDDNDWYEGENVFDAIKHMFECAKNRDVISDTYYYWRPIKSFTLTITITEDGE